MEKHNVNARVADGKEAVLASVDAMPKGHIVTDVSNISSKISSDIQNQIGIVHENELSKIKEPVLKEILAEVKPVNFYEIAAVEQGKSLSKKHYLVICIDEILRIAKEKELPLCINCGIVYCFNGSYWKQVTMTELQIWLGEIARAMGIDKFEADYYKFREELLKQFISAASLPSPERNLDEVLINLKGGTYVIRSDRQFLKPFDSYDFLTHQLDFPFDEKKEAPIFKEYLDKVLPEENSQKILAEYIGYLFISRKVLKLEKVLVLFGEGANGKSVFFEVVKALLGASMGCFSLQSLSEKSGYYRAQLKDLLCNYAPENSPEIDASIFKQMVSGEPIEARLPYQVPFIMEDYAKLIFNMNKLPVDVEGTEAYFRRFLIIPFNVTIPEEERDPQLAQKIIDNELSGVFNWVLEGLNRLLTQKRFTHSEEVDKLLAQYRMESSSVQLFLNDAQYCQSTESCMGYRQLYDEYKCYCKEFNYRAETEKHFSHELRKLKYFTIRKSSGVIVFAEKKVA